MATLTTALGRLSRRTRRRRFECPFVTVTTGHSFSCFRGRTLVSRSGSVPNPLTGTTAKLKSLRPHPLFSVSMSLSSSSSSSSSSTSSLQKTPLLGGEHAGFLAEFSPIDGSLLPVPIRLVPDELLLWGQAPECWEVLISEDLTLDDPRTSTSNNSSNGEGGIDSFRRRTVTVLPGVGCGLDSLETIRLEEVCDWNDDGGSSNSNAKNLRNGSNSTSKSKTTILDLWHDETDGTGVLDTLLHTRTLSGKGARGNGAPPATASTNVDKRPTSASKTPTVIEKAFRLETLFSLPQCEEGYRYRLRVALDVSVAQQNRGPGENNSTDRDTQTRESSYRYELSRSHSIRVSMERFCDHASDPSLSTLASGVHNDTNGHLDAGTVSDLIGKNPRLWKDAVARVPQHQRRQHRHDAKRKIDEEKFSREALLELPGSISISSGTIGTNDGWFIDVACSGSFPKYPESPDDSPPKQPSSDPPVAHERPRNVRREFRGFNRTSERSSQPNHA